MAAAPPTAKVTNAESLAYGAKSGNIAQVASLLDAGANPNAFETRLTPVCADAKDRDKITVRTTALMQAVLCGELEIAQLLIDRGADPDLRHRQDNGSSQQDDDSSQRGSHGLAPNMDHCKYMLDASPLMAAVSKGNTAMARLLIAHGADLDAVEMCGWTAFHAACFNNQPDCAEILVQAGCNVAATWNSAGTGMSQGLLTGKQVAEYNGHTEVLRRLAALARKAAKQGRLEGEAAGAAKAGAVVTLAGLLDAGADVNANIYSEPIFKALEGRPEPCIQLTLLYFAVSSGQVETARLILDRGGDPNPLAPREGLTPLMVAAQGGHTDVLCLLIQRGADLNARGSALFLSWTAFHFACSSEGPTEEIFTPGKNNSFATCIEELLRAGCDTTIVDTNGHTGMQVADMQGTAEVHACVAGLLSQGFLGST
jgi:ankyrin repeat protein